MTKNKKDHQPSSTLLKKRVIDLENRLTRALADYQNLEKRHASQKNEVVKHANESLLDKLLPVLDDLERAGEHINDPGLNMVTQQFQKALSSEDVTPIETNNQTFDPELMDCVEVVPGKKNQVINTITKGYLYHDRVLRPARVEVGLGGKQ